MALQETRPGRAERKWWRYDSLLLQACPQHSLQRLPATPRSPLLPLPLLPQSRVQLRRLLLLVLPLCLALLRQQHLALPPLVL